MLWQITVLTHVIGKWDVAVNLTLWWLGDYRNTSFMLLNYLN